MGIGISTNNSSRSIYDTIANNKHSINSTSLVGKSSDVTENVEKRMESLKKKSNPKRGFFQRIFGFFKSLFNAVKKAITSVFNAIKSVIKSVVDAIKNLVKGVINTIANFVKDIASGKGLFEALKNSMKNISSSIKEMTTKLADGIKKLAKDTINIATDLIKNVGSLARDMLKFVTSAVLGDKIANFIDNALKKATESVIDVAKKGIEFIADAAMGIVDNVVNVATAISDIASGAGGFKGILKNLGKVAVNALEIALSVGTGGTAGMIKEAAEQAVKKIMSKVMSKLDDVMNIAKKAVPDSKVISEANDVKKITQNTKNKIDDTVESFNDRLDRMIDDAIDKLPGGKRIDSQKVKETIRDVFDEYGFDPSQMANEYVQGKIEEAVYNEFGDEGLMILNAVLENGSGVSRKNNGESSEKQSNEKRDNGKNEQNSPVIDESSSTSISSKMKEYLKELAENEINNAIGIS